MFETRAEVKAMFEQFRTVDNVADLYSDQALENHALLVMNALDEAISNMDDEAYLMSMLLNTGRSHLRFENFSASIFWVSIPQLSSRTRGTASVWQIYFWGSGKRPRFFSVRAS